jgi:serine/threonine-protein kinase
MRVKILDFGIAKLGADRFGAKQKTQGGTILGTPSYMAPEQCKAESNIDARADLYALGCILFELLTGRAPFDAEAGAEIMAMHILEPAPRLSTYAPQLPAELDALIAKLLVKTPADRTPSAAYAHAALERVPMPPIAGYVELFDASGARAGTYTPPVADAPEPRTSKWFPIVILLVALAIAGAAIYFIGLRGDELGK